MAKKQITNSSLIVGVMIHTISLCIYISARTLLRQQVAANWLALLAERPREASVGAVGGSRDRDGGVDGSARYDGRGGRRLPHGEEQLVAGREDVALGF